MTPPVARDRRFHRGKVRPGRRRRLVGSRLWTVLRVAAVLCVTAYAGWRGATLVSHIPALQVSHITVVGNHRLTTGEVQALLDGLHGQNILAVDLDRARQQLLASPWVEDAGLRRVLPSQVEVSIRERRPIGLARLGEVLYLVDAAGVVIDEFGPNYADLDLPIIDGLDGVPEDGVVDEQRARLAARVVEGLEGRPELARRVSQIDVSDARDAVVMLEGDTALLRLGEEDFADRIQGYLDLATALRERVNRIDYVDLRYGERLYIKGARP